MDEPRWGQGLAALRCALAELMADAVERPFLHARSLPHAGFAGTGSTLWASIPASGRMLQQTQRGHDHPSEPWLLTQAVHAVAGDRYGDGELAASSAEDESEGRRIIALVELARGGDKEAFGLLYDHYHVSVYRFLSYRVGSQLLAEDLTSETFFRALRSMNSFRWQGKDFGAWLMTIARNLATDHFKAGRTRLERTTEDMETLDTTAEGPESEVLANLDNQELLSALQELPQEQRECLVMRFLEGLAISETAERMGRSPGAVKQLQLRGVRNLAKLVRQDTP